METTTSETQLMPYQVLTLAERQQLSYFKSRFVLQVLGFSPWQACQLTFLTWLRATGRC